MSDRKDYKAPPRQRQGKEHRLDELRNVRKKAAEFFKNNVGDENAWKPWMYNAGLEWDQLTRGRKDHRTAKQFVDYLRYLVPNDRRVRELVQEVSASLDRLSVPAPVAAAASASASAANYNESAGVEWAPEEDVSEEELARALATSHSPPRVKIPAAAAASSPRAKSASSSPRSKGSPKGKGSAAARTIWEEVCGNAEDPISLNSWSELGPDADVVSIFSAEGGGDKGKCYERKSLTDSFAHNQNLAWPGPTKVFKMPEGEWIVEGARAVLTDQKWSVYQLIESRGFHGVGARREDSQKEAVYQIVPVQSLAELRTSLRPRRQSPVRPPPEAPVRPRKRRQGAIDLTEEGDERDRAELLAEIEELHARLNKCHLDLALCRSEARRSI